MDRDAESPKELVDRHADDVARRVGGWRRAPDHFAGGAIFQAQLCSVFVKMAANTENAAVDRRFRLPRALGMAWWDVERMGTGRGHHIHIEGIDPERADVARRRCVWSDDAQRGAVGLVGGVVQHGRNEQ